MMDKVYNMSALLSSPLGPIWGRSSSHFTLIGFSAKLRMTQAGVTQLAECVLPKHDVAGSNPVTRSIKLSEMLETTPLLFKSM